MYIDCRFNILLDYLLLLILYKYIVYICFYIFKEVYI